MKSSRIAVLWALGVSCNTGTSPSGEPLAGDTSTSTGSGAVASDTSTSGEPPADDTIGSSSTEGGSTSDSGASSSTGDPPPIEGACKALDSLIAELADQPEDAEALIEAFFHDVVYEGDGFPMVEDERVCFAYRDPVGIPLSVAGDFNDWVVGEHDLDYASGAYDLRYAIVEAPSAGAEGLYKFVRVADEAEYFADPMARRFGWDEFGEYSRIGVDPGTSHYERWPSFEIGVGDLQPRDLVVYVPAGPHDDDSLGVLYMHDGQNLFAPDALFGGWRVGGAMDFAIAQRTIAPTLVVGIHNTSDRFDEYTHVADDLGGMLQGGRADEYAAFIVDGIKPFIDARYPTTNDVGRTAVAGSSLGGLVSLYVGWRHPEVFGAAASMSGTVGWGSFGAGEPTVAELFSDTPPLGLRIYLDTGGSAGAGCPNGGSDNYCDNVALADTLRSLGWVDDSDLFYVWEPDALHNEAEWAERFPQMIADWLPAQP